MKNFLKDLLKKFFDTRIVREIVAWLFYIYIFIVYKTSKIIVKGSYDELKNYINNGKGLVLFTWHGRLLITPPELDRLFRNEKKMGKKIVALSSNHRDGKIVSTIIAKFRMDSIAGSTIDHKKGSSKNKKSLTSIRNAIRTLTNGDICVLAADGPRGPACKMNTKITDIAQKTGTGITYTAVSYKRKKVLKTWDSFNFAFPFNKIIVEYGKIVEIDKDQNIDDVNKFLENELNKTIKQNDEILKLD